MLANPKRTKDEIVQWIRSYFESNGPGCDAVIGISGGKDSSVVAALCVEALGKERVVGVMMPNGEQPDLDDSKQLIEFLGIRYAYTDISKAVSAVSDQVALNMNVSDQTRINLPPPVSVWRPSMLFLSRCLTADVLLIPATALKTMWDILPSLAIAPAILARSLI